MTRLRPHAPAFAAALLLGLAAVLVLFALDARAWHSTVARDDLRFRALPAHVQLWRPPTLLPGDPAGRVIGTGGTIAYRRALQLFWFSRLGADPEAPEDLPTIRAQAQEQLLQLAASSAPASERSNAANLVGVLVVTTPINGSDSNAVMQLLRDATGAFQRAISIDPTNTDAKENLELVLRLTKPGKGRLGRDARSGYGFGRGRGAAPTGSGY